MDATRRTLSDPDLLSLRLATGFVMTDSGRMLRVNAPDRTLAPRLYLTGCESGNLVRLRQDVGSATAGEIEALVADEPPLYDVDQPPKHQDEYVELLARETPIESVRSGLAWYFPEHLQHVSEVQLIISESAEGEDLLARLARDGVPEPLVALGFVDLDEFWPPWCVALYEDQIASIAFAACLGPNAAETGVTTVPEFRRRGFATAATAGYAAQPSLRNRVLFYGTDRSNRSSHHVAERLGLRYLGATFSIA
jgi:RimJ/RimL family protein N-acetyltransferase